ncbi:MAG TPA: hypothetical protein VLB84_05065 [Bacteroidia bacterium]|nr:hypothetical protein [Bacteroidia bacterium]
MTQQEMNATNQNMYGKWQYKEDDTDLIVRILEGKLEVNGTLGGEKIHDVELKTGNWWVDPHLIFDGSPFFIRKATSEKLIFGEFKKAGNSSDIKWQFEFDRITF